MQGISVRGVSQAFGAADDARRVVALEEATLDIPAGELGVPDRPERLREEFAARHHRGAREAGAGSVTIDGEPVRGPLPKRVSFVFQENALFPWLTVYDNILAGLAFQGAPKDERRPRADEALSAVGLVAFRDHYPRQLSGGMKQRAQLARALSLQTEILLMDEPFAALDEQTRLVARRRSLRAAGANEQDDRLRDAQSRRSGVSRRPRGRLHRAPRPDQDDHHRRRTAPAVVRIHDLGETRRPAQRALRTLTRRGAQGDGRGGRRLILSRRTRQRLVQIACVAVVFGAWQIGSSTGALDPLILPPLPAIVVALGGVLRTGTVWADVGLTLLELAIAFAIAAGAGLLAGFVISRSPLAVRVFDPLIAGLYAVPTILLFPLYLLFFGIGPPSKIALGATMAVFPIVLSTIAGFAQADAVRLAAARSMGASGLQLFWYVLVPEAFPVVIAGLRMGLVLGFLAILGGETITSNAGIGHAIVTLAESLEPARMFAYIVVAIAVAMALNALTSYIEARGKHENA